MELVFFDTSRVINLTTVHRSAGEAFQPEIVQAAAQRYSFIKTPTLEELLKREIHFRIGKFQDVQIQEFDIFSDGVIAGSASHTDKILAFLQDVFAWANEAFGYSASIVAKPEIYFESAVVVKSEVDLARALTPKGDITSLVGRAFKQASSIEAEFESTGFIADVDSHSFSGRRKPMQFAFERRIGFPFSENVFYSRAPLPTTAHLDVLRAIEDLARRA